MELPPKGLAAEYNRLFIQKNPVPLGVHEACLWEARFIQNEDYTVYAVAMTWRPAERREWQIHDIAPLGEDPGARAAGQARLISLFTACRRPDWRPKLPRELIGLRCRIVIKPAKHWNSERMFSIVSGYQSVPLWQYLDMNEE